MIRILGHRGGRNLWPENSLQGFREAIALGVDIVEFDVNLSSDGEMMVIHDPTLERTTHGSGLVCEHSAEALRSTMLRDSDEGVSTLDAALDVFEPVATEVFIEIKTDARGRHYPGLERRILDNLARRGMTRRAAIVCFVPEVLETARDIEPAIQVLAPVFRPTSQMYGGLEKMLDRPDLIPGCLVSVERSLLAVARDYCLERLGPARLCVGVNNEPDELAFWMTQAVRQVGSDRPDLALAARARHGRSTDASAVPTGRIRSSP